MRYRHRNGGGIANQLGAVHVRAGELAIVLGPNGSGKTTMIKVLVGLLKPHAGAVRLFGTVDPAALSAAAIAEMRQTKVGYVPAAGGGLLEFATVVENVGLRAGLAGAPATRTAELVRRAMALAEVPPEWAGRRPASLSHGERARVAVARALCPEPDLLLVDEPDGHLDPQSCRDMYRLLRSAAGRGVAVVAVSHRVTSVRYADRVVAVRAGQVAWQRARAAGFDVETFSQMVRNLYV